MPYEQPEITVEQACKVLKEKFGGTLKHGGHSLEECNVCVRELRAYLLDPENWTDHPDQGETTNQAMIDDICILLNDIEGWIDIDRTDILLPLVTLSRYNAHPDWQQIFMESSAHVSGARYSDHPYRNPYDFVQYAHSRVNELRRNHRYFESNQLIKELVRVLVNAHHGIPSTTADPECVYGR